MLQLFWGADEVIAIQLHGLIVEMICENRNEGIRRRCNPFFSFTKASFSTYSFHGQAFHGKYHRRDYFLGKTWQKPENFLSRTGMQLWCRSTGIQNVEKICWHLQRAKRLAERVKWKMPEKMSSSWHSQRNIVGEDCAISRIAEHFISIDSHTVNCWPHSSRNEAKRTECLNWMR